LTSVPSRRDVLRGLVGAGLGLVAARLPDTAEAKKKRKQRPKKSKPNQYGCLSVGAACKNAELCCSGICEGKKGKRKCRAHGAGTCDQTQRGACTAADPAATACNDTEGCNCLETTAGSTFCGPSGGPGIACAGCLNDADCERLGFPPGSACIPLDIGRCVQACVNGRACVAPCGYVPPDPEP
jgi:hypothetical protein